MTTRKVVADLRYVQEVRDELYFSTMQAFGGGVEPGDDVVIVSQQTGNVLALGKVVAEGQPYPECRSVKVTKKFE